MERANLSFTTQLRRFTRLALRLFILAVPGGLKVVSRWIGLPLFVIFVMVGVAAVLVTAVLVAKILQGINGHNPQASDLDNGVESLLNLDSV